MSHQIPQLIPRPRDIRIDGESLTPGAPILPERALSGTDPASDAWQLLADLAPATLPEQGYALRVRIEAGEPQAIIAAADESGLMHARATLAQLAGEESIAPLSIRDWPQLGMRGTIEGFYGGPWSHQARLDFLTFSGQIKLNTYIYAPKDEPYHRDRWREAYPQDQLERIGELVSAAAAAGIRFVYALAPALSMRFEDHADQVALAAKAEQLWQAGVRSFALLFDDVPTELTDPEDVAVFGSDAGATGAAHGTTCTRFVRDFLAPHGVHEPLLVCPTDYAGCAPSPYRSSLAETMPEDVQIMWTGSDIVVGTVSRDDIEAARAEYRRDVVLWDNYPVNDFDRPRLFLGPLHGRTRDVVDSGLIGIAINPMVESQSSRFAIASAADWAWNPAGYDETDSAGRARALVAGEDAFDLEPLIAACSSWPPSAPQSEDLRRLVDRALNGDSTALDLLEDELSLLEASGGDDFDPEASDAPKLIQELSPWIVAARDVGRAGVLACRLLRRTRRPDESEDLSADRDALVAARRAAEQHYANVLRSLMPEFFHAVLAEAGMVQPAPEHARHITVLIGANPAPGDRELSERLIAKGYDVTLSSRIETPQTLAASDLVIITRASSIDAARAAVAIAVPVLVWAHLEALGLATSSAVTLSRDTLEITDERHPLAAGFSGRVQVYGGTGKLTWGEPSEDGEVVARGLDPEHPVIVHYPSGALLPGGRTAPAARTMLFLGAEGLAPWLMSDDGYTMVNAAIDHLSAWRLVEAPNALAVP